MWPSNLCWIRQLSHSREAKGFWNDEKKRPVWLSEKAWQNVRSAVSRPARSGLTMFSKLATRWTGMEPESLSEPAFRVQPNFFDLNPAWICAPSPQCFISFSTFYIFLCCLRRLRGRKRSSSFYDPQRDPKRFLPLIRPFLFCHLRTSHSKMSIPKVSISWVPS